MYKGLRRREDTCKLYVTRKGRETGLTFIESSVDYVKKNWLQLPVTEITAGK